MPLTQQRNYWNTVISANPDIRCIYTGKPIITNDFDLDHFIPWSFVSHDLMWTLAPVDKSTNISKSNKLSDINIYLPKIASVQQIALKTIYKLDPSNKLLEDYINMDASISELVDLDFNSFYNLYSHTISPIYHVAEKMGYEKWTK